MKKKASKKASVLQNPIMKAIPLSVALSIMSAGMAFGGTTSTIQVELEDGKTYSIDVPMMKNDQAYAGRVKAALQYSFNNGKKLIVKDEDKGWIDFGGNAKNGVTYDTMLLDSTQFEAAPDPDATPY